MVMSDNDNLNNEENHLALMIKVIPSSLSNNCTLLNDIIFTFSLEAYNSEASYKINELSNGRDKSVVPTEAANLLNNVYPNLVHENVKAFVDRHENI